jgi:L-arabinose isomerase
MPEYGKPRIGVLALMLEAYEPLFPGITHQQESYVQSALSVLSAAIDFHFPRVALNRQDIEDLTRQFNSDRLDGILIMLLTYSQGQYLVRAMQNNNLPLALALVQPDETVCDDFEELDLTVNQGIHGSQDNANCLVRAGIRCSYFAGSRHDGSFERFITDFAKAAQTAQLLKSMKIGVIGKLAGMGDLVADDMAFFRSVGPEFLYDSVGTLHSFVQNVTEEEIAERVAADRKTFEMDPKLSAESHSYAIRLYLGIKKYLEHGGYSGYSAHFDEFGADGRFLQLPLLAASHLMADGYGYAAEGDGVTASLVAAARCLCGNANFSEMYMMDFARKAILFCHAGEGNWATCRSDRKPRLIDRFLGEGGLGNPPTAIFTPQFGPATVASLLHLGGGKYRMVAAAGEILPISDLKKCEMPYFFFAPASGVQPCVTAWLKYGGPHHEAIVLGDHRSRLKLLCEILGIEYAEA